MPPRCAIRAELPSGFHSVSNNQTAQQAQQTAELPFRFHFVLNERLLSALWHYQGLGRLEGVKFLTFRLSPRRDQHAQAMGFTF
ncbi:hypothetical protein M493_15150 [Geobacillus genomosp. 3]|uniref:Uncharacterized protein n=1 Tax=Geobacillus genomosp. 3 TaxID=1921421 RepID=S6A3N5_GEOG3|nr:hypothetical protein M493_15150 [Geobacillus genomosp. 3]